MRNNSAVRIGLIWGLALFTTSAWGQTNSWNGGTGSWFEPTNWLPIRVPTEFTQVSINNGGTAEVTQPGGVVRSLDLGGFPGASGTLTISGTGQLTTNLVNAETSIGREGSGSVVVSAGGKFTTWRAGLGVFRQDAIGAATVDGAGSLWDGRETLLVGVKGQGLLTLFNGGEVKAGDDIVLGRDAGSTGIARVDGSKISALDQFGVGFSGAGTLEITNGGTVAANVGYVSNSATALPSTATVDRGTWTNTGFLSVGHAGNGTLNIVNGGTVEATNGHVGLVAGSNGKANVSGANSKWTNTARLFIAGGTDVGNGRGTLTVSDKGLVAVGDLLKVWNGNGFVNQRDTGRIVVGRGANLFPTEGGLYVGNSMAVGAMEILGGGDVDTTGIARIDGLQGTRVTVEGLDSTWIPRGNLVVGRGAFGELKVMGGATVGLLLLTSASIGVAEGSNGTVVVNGAGAATGSTQLFAKSLQVGIAGTGRVTITAGGRVHNSSAVLGVDSLVTDGMGIVDVDGAGSQWTVDDELVVGALGNGDLLITNGGVVQNGLELRRNEVVIGKHANVGTRGNAVVSGVNSKLNVFGNVVVGASGTGTLTVKNNGQVQSDYGFIGFQKDSRGTVVVERGSWDVRENLIVGSFGSATLDIGTDPVSTVRAARALIGPNGKVTGIGNLKALVNNLGTVSPGKSPGTLTIEGDYTQGDTGKLEIEIAGANSGQFDVLKVLGNITLGGELMLEFIDGFAPRQGNQFQFLDISGTLSGQFGEVEIVNLAPGFQFDLRRDGGNMTMVALNDGVFVAPPPVSIWNVDADGNWSSAGNWTVAVPNAPGAAAIFANKITAPRTVTADVPITIGRIEFDSTAAYTIAGSNTVTVAAATGNAHINLISGNHTISAPLTLADNTRITISPSTANLTITGPVSAGNVTLTKEGAGALSVNNLRAAGLSVNGGTVAIAPNGTEAGTSALGTLSIAGATDAWTAKLDLNNNDAIIQSTAANKSADFARLHNQIKQGFNNGAWTGLGITSATAASNANTDTGLAVVDNALLGYTNFSGQPVAADSILLKYTFYGDIDANGAVDADDLTVFANNFGRATGATQIDGDIDFNGTVDADDLTVFANNFNKGVGNPLTAGGVQAVPEPQAVGLMAIGLVALLVPAWMNRRIRAGATCVGVRRSIFVAKSPGAR